MIVHFTISPRLCGAALLLTLGAGALAQDAVRVQPRSYSAVLDNAHVRVLEFTGRPGMGVCGTGMHSHPAHLTVLLSAAKVRVRVGNQVHIVALKEGDVFWEEAVTHETENIGGTPIRSLLIEMKKP